MEGQIIGLCDNNTPFVGISACPTFESQPKGLVITTSDFSIPATPLDDDGTVITQGEYLAQEAERAQQNIKVYPLLEGLVNLEVSGGDSRIVQEGFGSSSINGHNEYQETYTYTKGGICLFKQVLKLHGQDIRVFWVDLDNRCYGVAQSDGTIKGFEATLGAQYRRNQGTVMAGYIITLIYSNKYINNFKSLTSFLLPDDIHPIREIYPKVVGMADGGGSGYTNIYIELRTSCSDVQLKWGEGLFNPSVQDPEIVFDDGTVATVTQTGSAGVALNRVYVGWASSAQKYSGKFRLHPVAPGTVSALKNINSMFTEEWSSFNLADWS